MTWRIWAGMAGLALILGSGCLCGIRGKCAVAPPAEDSGSAVVKSATYDADTQTLTMTFPNGSRYAYSEVPPEVHTGLEAAESKGRFYHSEIKGKFPSTRLDP